MLKELNKQDFEAFYDILTDSFPPDELRSRQEHRALLERTDYRVYALYDAGVLQAFLTVWEFPEFAFIEHFAVKRDCRSKGLGSDLLRQLRQLLSKRLVLEAELPETDMACRRLDFYRRNGFYVNQYAYVQPPMEPGKKPVAMHLLTGDGAVDEAAFQSIRAVLYGVVYEGKLHGERW